MSSLTTIHATRPAYRPSMSFGRGAAYSFTPPTGLQLLRPVYWIAGGIAGGIAFHFDGIEAVAIMLAALIALWAFAEPGATLANAIVFMVFLFVFFQREAPLGDELPEEFFYWGAGVALITAALCIATVLGRNADWQLIKKRLFEPTSIAMLALFGLIGVAAINGLLLGNQLFAVVRQLFGCLLLPVYYFAGLALFRSSTAIDRWINAITWAVALGALWYAQKLSFASLARGVYFREQSPLTSYAGAVGVMAFAALIERRGIWRRLQGFAQTSVCTVSIVLMGNRAALASLIVGCGLLVIIRLSQRGVIAAALAIVFVAGSIGSGFYYGDRLLEHRGLGGDIARRFIIRVSEDHSFQGRMAQMEAVLSAVSKRPILGAGMGSETVFLAPEEGRLRLTSVDNGWGYVMLKTGLLGLAIFLVLIGLTLSRCIHGLRMFPTGALRANSMALLGIMAYGVVVFWSGPAFLHFTSAGFFGTTFAAILVLAESRATETATAREAACPR